MSGGGRQRELGDKRRRREDRKQHVDDRKYASAARHRHNVAVADRRERAARPPDRARDGDVILLVAQRKVARAFEEPKDVASNDEHEHDETHGGPDLVRRGKLR